MKKTKKQRRRGPVYAWASLCGGGICDHSNEGRLHIYNNELAANGSAAHMGTARVRISFIDEKPRKRKARKAKP